MSKNLRNTTVLFLSLLIFGVIAYRVYSTKFLATPTYEQVSLTLNDELKSKTTKWCLGCKAEAGNTYREVRATFPVQTGIKTITAHVKGGNDDTGDKCVIGSILSPSNAVLKSTKICSGSKKWDKFTVTVSSPGKYKLVLLDTDTSLIGKHPGNGGSYKISLKK